MGCLLFPLELLVELIIEGWFSLMEWIVPQRALSCTFRRVLKALVWAFSSVLLLTMVLGICAVISDDEYTKHTGRYMVFVPLVISMVQILLGVIVRIISQKRK